MPVIKNMTLAITSPGEGERLWKHVLFGTSTCVQMIEGYADLAMPGNPCAALVALRDRIEKVLSKYEESHADDHSRGAAEHRAPDDEPQSQALPG
jgi:molybdopterin biosynthesis enzyme